MLAISATTGYYRPASIVLFIGSTMQVASPSARHFSRSARQKSAVHHAMIDAEQVVEQKFRLVDFTGLRQFDDMRGHSRRHYLLLL